MYQSFTKRVLDFLVAIIGFLILAPIFIIVLIILLIVNNGKPFFLQERPGYKERIFKIIKFKTMNDKKDANGELLTPDKRLTKFGLFIRKRSLDEIPQLINVIKGDMSIVGPRPLLIRYLPRYNNTQKQRHNVRPGITGWAQVNGRNAISWEQKFKLDVYYVNNISCILDLKILFKTVYKVIKKDGIYSTDNEIVPDFMGEEQNKY